MEKIEIINTVYIVNIYYNKNMIRAAASIVAAGRTAARAFSSSRSSLAELRKTPLWELHKEKGATFSEFGGW